MPEVTLYYFNAKGVAEGARMLLAYGGQEFKDQRFTFEEWPQYKPRAATNHYEQDEEIKKKKHEEFSKNIYPVMLKQLNDIIEENNGHIAAGKLTWGDFFIAGFFSYLKGVLQRPDLDETYPGFKKLLDNVYSIPRVKAYADAAPETFNGW